MQAGPVISGSHRYMVFSIYDSTEDAVMKMIAANERTLNLGGSDGIVDAAYDGLKVD